LQSFPFARQPSVNKAQVLTLAGLDFLRRGENLLLIGPPGTGKSGIAVGLLREACLNGYRARFYNAQALLDELYASLADRSTVGLLNQLCRLPLIAIDELGYLNLKPEQVNAFFRLMDQRYSLRLSTILTTNLDLPDWYELFQKKPLVDALLDRLQHRCTLLRLSGPSLRSEPAVSQARPDGGPAGPRPQRAKRPQTSPRSLEAPATGASSADPCRLAQGRSPGSPLDFRRHRPRPGSDARKRRSAWQ
jgi:DNA replication protein DnaC